MSLLSALAIDRYSRTRGGRRWSHWEYGSPAVLAFLTLNTAIRFRLAASSHCVYIACHNSLRILTQKTLKLILTVVLLLGFYYYDDYDDDDDDDDHHHHHHHYHHHHARLSNHYRCRRHHFCRATLCISAAYTALRCLSVRPSVLLSVTFVYCAKTTSHILKLVHPRVATSF